MSCSSRSRFRQPRSSTTRMADAWHLVDAKLQTPYDF
jgi:hypothetical protein